MSSVTPVPPPLASPASTTALTNLPSSSSYHELPSLPSQASARKLSTHAETKEEADGLSTASSPLHVEFHTERQQLTYRIQTASTRAHLSLTRPTEGAVAGVVSEPTAEQMADLLSSEEKSALETDVHIASSQQLAKRLNSDITRGLTSAQVSEARVKYGANVLTPPPTRSYLLLFLNQLIAGFSVILWIAGLMIFLSWRPLGSIGGATPQVVNLGISILIVIVILISAVFNFYQEVRAAQIVKSFSNIVPSHARVIRDGREMEVLASELVPGDIVNLNMGDKVPADVRLLSVSGLQLNNSALTGESEPVTCSTKTTSLNYMESLNLGFYSALIVQGRGTGLVTATGDKTVLGQVSQLTQSDTSTDTNLHREIRRFVLFITIAALFTGVLAFIMWGAWLKDAYPAYMPVSSIVMNAFSLIVAYVPEGLPVCVTLTLTMVAKRMYKQKVLAKNLAIIETFNSVSVIATDKTGTLTMNQMTVQKMLWPSRAAESNSATAIDSADDSAFDVSTWSPPAADVSESDATKGSDWVMEQQSFGNSKVARQLIQGATLCNVAELTAKQDGTASLSGDAADVALYELLRSKLAVNIIGQRQMLPRVRMLPFNSTNKCMITLNTTADGTGLCYMKGAPEVILDKCTHYACEQGESSSDGSVEPLTDAVRASILSLQERFGRDGYRLIGMCRQEWLASTGWAERDKTITSNGAGTDTAPATPNSTTRTITGSTPTLDADYNHLPATGYTFLGMFALLDPPRPNVTDSVNRAHAAGIRVMMVTGDHSSTAQAIGKQVGILTDECVSKGVRRVKLGKDELDRAVMQMTVDGKVIETHVLGTNPNHASVTVSTGSEDDSASVTPQLKGLHNKQTSWKAMVTEWWQSTFGLSVGTVVQRIPPVPHACVLTGSDIKAFDVYMWSWALAHRELVFARTSPEQKLQIVQALQARGEVVAVTGDGTNDSPALKKADLGVAMQAGAEVAREAGDMILLDNNFASIIQAIEQGRLVHDNLKKAALYLLPGGSWSEMFPVLINVFLGVPLSLSSFQMIIICVLTDVANALAIVQEKPESALMARPPANQHTSHLIDWRFLWHAYLEIGTICSFSAWFNYIQYFKHQGIAVSDTFLAWTWMSESCCQAGDEQCLLDDAANCYSSQGRIFSNDELADINYTGQSIFFVSLVITGFFNMYATRTRYTSFFAHNPLFGPGRNLWLIVGTVVGACVAVVVTQAQWFNDVFLTRPVPVGDVAPAIGFGMALFVFDEVRKYWVRNYPYSWWAKTAW